MSGRYRKRFPTVMPLSVLLLVALLMPPQQSLAQAHEIHGTVVSASDGAPLPGASVVETGTQSGTSTNFEGEFRMSVSDPNASITVSFIGFLSKTTPVNGQTEFVVALEEDVGQMEEVVVTAFGIERQQRAVGYSVSKVSGENLRESRENNVANALAGKVAGVVVSKPATGPAGSSRVIIRGNTSLEGDNQPLYVVDGVPIDNSNFGSAGMWGGTDQGDGIQSINPDDIEDISVLKGPAAAALYGTRAQNGVILITTKTGQGMGNALGIEFNSNMTFEDALIGYQDYQTAYGQGSRGEAPSSQEEAFNNSSSWGARLNGQDVVQFDGVARPYVNVGNKLDSYYNTGLTATNTLSFTGGFENTTFRFSGSYLDNQSIVPESGLQRYTLNLRGTSRFGERLEADVKMNYIREDVDKRTRLSDSPGNPNNSIAILPPNVDPEILKPGHVEGNEHQELMFDSNIWSTNPYWASSRYVDDDSENRFIGFALLRYSVADWLSLQGRVGQDWYALRRTTVTPYGTAYQPAGSMNDREINVLERNWDFLVNANRNLFSGIGLNAAIGGNRMDRNFEELSIGGSSFNIPGLETPSNLANQSSGYGYSQKRINSLYGSAEFSYQDYFFLTVTGRNDWSSTLPLDNNSYFYPSVSASLIFSDVFAVPSWMSFGKLRASWAEVGGDTDPYRLLPSYRLYNFTHQGQPLGGLAQSSIPLAALKPSSSVGIEAGFDLRFFNDRLGLELTWYDQTTTNQILGTTVVNSTGFSSKVINAGEMANSGIEALLTTTPLRTTDFRWDFDINYARNVNEVVELTEGLESLNLDQARSQTAWIVAQIGEPFSTIRGYAYERDTEGNIVLDEAGLPLRGKLEVLGVGVPDWTSGIMNTIRYKNLSVSALVDVNWGGEIFSGTNVRAYGAGVHEKTLEGRAECEAVGYDANDGNGCWVPEGVVNPPRDEEGNITGPGTPNTTATFPQSYWGTVGSRIAEEFVYDASYIKLREIQLRFRLPASWMRRSPVQVATVAVVARNLALLYSKVPNVDPESNYNNSNAQGLEWTGMPQTRSIGLNLNIRM